MIASIARTDAPDRKRAYDVVKLDDCLPLPGDIVWADAESGCGAMVSANVITEFDFGARAIAIVRKR